MLFSIQSTLHFYTYNLICPLRQALLYLFYCFSGWYPSVSQLQTKLFILNFLMLGWTLTSLLSPCPCRLPVGFCPQRMLRREWKAEGGRRDFILSICFLCMAVPGTLHQAEAFAHFTFQLLSTVPAPASLHHSGALSTASGQCLLLNRGAMQTSSLCMLICIIINTQWKHCIPTSSSNWVSYPLNTYWKVAAIWPHLHINKTTLQNYKVTLQTSEFSLHYLLFSSIHAPFCLEYLPFS